MALAFRLPGRRIDYSFRALSEARMSLARVQSKHEEVKSVGDTLQAFCEEHLFVVHVQRKPKEENTRAT